MTQNISNTANTDFDNMPAEKQDYIRLRTHNRKLYDAKSSLTDAQTLALNSNRTPQQDFELAQLISNATTLVNDAAKGTYYQQLQIEKTHPEYKEEAKAQAERLKQQSQQQEGQTLQAVV